uniref:Subtilisin-like protease n=1 Tax=Picea sitchensis TaxID=3332 RepID=C0PQV9_PICSI|nr:unknown [Picea sitchensis]
MENSRACYVLVFVMAAFASGVPNSDALDTSHEQETKVMEITKQSYIVYMDKSMKPEHFSLHQHWYTSLIDEVSGSNSDPAAMLYTYDTVTHGFAAKLTSTEAQAMENTDGCLAVFPDSVYRLHTTRTPDFLGLSSSHGLWPLSHYADDIIVGVLDTGIWPESKSFSDQGLTQVPARWKGECEMGTEFNASHCNNKLIGARFFLKGYEAKYGHVDEMENYRSPRDEGGHGTHTSSTAAGAEVPGSSLLGFAAGTARGIATKARLAVYKVCWPEECLSSDLLAGMEAAISDGVDLLSLSISDNRNLPYYKDAIAIGALGAIEKGVFVSCAAGNAGPIPSKIFNTAPWITTVGASTIDREFPAPVVLGNGKNYRGSSLYKGKTLGNGQLPLIYGKSASSNETAKFCLPGSLDSNRVSGKIVLCDLGGGEGTAEMGLVVRQAGGAGMIQANRLVDGEDLWTDCHFLPATKVDFKSGIEIKAYINRTKNPTATIKAEGATVVGKTRAPVVASFSSRGPNPLVPEILKPDLIAPGVNVLAAWSGHVSPTGLTSDKRRVDYNIISGTSMACPHVTGIAALILAVHSAWTPAAIKSALMTSSVPFDHSKRLISESVTALPADAFAIGAGHVNPSAALDPGLVYDADFDDYVSFLCSLNYTRSQIHILTRKASSCTRIHSQQPGDLNYPSFSVVFKPLNLVRALRRTVTNVGGAPCVYEVSMESPPGVNIIVEPRTLVFKEQNEKASYTVRFESKTASHNKSSRRQEFGQFGGNA